MKRDSLNKDILGLNRWSIISVSLAVFSLFINLINPTVLQFSLTTFFFSFILSLVIWNLLGAIIKVLPSKISLLLKVLIALVLPILITIGIKVYTEFGVFIDQNIMGLGLNDPTYLANVITVFFSNLWIILGFLLISILTFLFINTNNEKVSGKKSILIKIVTLTLALSIGQNQFLVSGYSDFTTIDTSFLFAYKLTTEDTKTLTKSTQRNVPNKGEGSSYNIVLIVQESMSVEPLSFYGYNNDYTPFFQDWTQKEDSNFVLFTDAMAISGCTDISIPTLYTGVGPEENYEKLMTSPFMWDYAKVNNYETALVSSQRYSWRNLRSFLKNKSLDLIYTSEDSDLKTVNDLGVDDIAVSQWAKDYIVTRDKTKPLFFVYNSNALHRPYQNESSLLKIPTKIKDRYGRALYIIDKTVQNIYNAFDATGELDNTIFIFTSDHGDYTARRIQRLGSFLKETLQIPIMVRFPQKWIDENRNKYNTIKSNENNRISNLDLNPTIIDLLKSTQANKASYDSLTGTSLFTEIDNHRTITCLSTNEIREWSNDGFGLYHDSLSYILDSYNEEQLYNLTEDVNQENNVIDSTPSSSLLRYYKMIEKNELLKQIYEEHQNHKKE